MTWMDFTIRLLVGFFLGVGIGIERQWLRSRAILKTNVLVTLGAAMFVMLSIMTPDDASPTRISAQIVSGVGFLGGGVILREGASVRGTNTAATLWCAAAIGTFVGSGYLVQAYLGTFAVVSANLLLRPLVEAFRQPEIDIGERNTDSSWEDESKKNILPLKEDRSSVSAQELLSSPNITSSKWNLEVLPDSRIESSASPYEQNTRYSCYLTCSTENEEQVLSVLFQSAKERRWKIIGLESKNTLENHQSEPTEIVKIKADFLSGDRNYAAEHLQGVLSSLKSNSLVSSVSWQFYI